MHPTWSKYHPRGRKYTYMVKITPTCSKLLTRGYFFPLKVTVIPWGTKRWSTPCHEWRGFIWRWPDFVQILTKEKQKTSGICIKTGHSWSTKRLCREPERGVGISTTTATDFKVENQRLKIYPRGETSRGQKYNNKVAKFHVVNIYFRLIKFEIQKGFFKPT